MNLSPRLSKALELVPEGMTVRDIGADHGFLSLELASTGHKVYSVENKKGPYQNLLKTLKDHPKESIIPLFQDGLHFIPEDVEGIILLGRGGNTIYKILKEKEGEIKKLKFILVEPQSDFPLVISYLLNCGFANDVGQYIFERHYYPLLRFAPCQEKQAYDEDEIEFGPYPVRNSDEMLLKFVQQKLEVLATLSSRKKMDMSQRESQLRRIQYKLRRNSYGSKG